MSVRGFRFRAQPALDHRKREDEDAQRALAHATTHLRAARSSLDEAERRAADARAQWAAVFQQPGGSARQFWYQSWILRLDRECAAAAAVVAAREKERARAAAERLRTHQRVEALERFKEKSVRAWQRHVAAEERKHLDALATIRFFTATRQREDESRTNGTSAGKPEA